MKNLGGYTMFNSEPDRSNLRYAMYLRKSTEDEKKQSHSIADQKKECMEHMAKLGLEKNIVQIIEESASAKYYGNRPKFTKMLADLESGKLDGIVAYHPDRLARNMREGGIVIDMLTPGKPKKKGVKEEPIIKDLTFSNFYFSNDINNRCMLAFQFAMATQYSEHLSEVVTRGTNSHLATGHAQGAHKWGYYRNASGFYVPDKYFDIVKEAWEMYRNGKNQTEITEFLVSNDVHYMTKTTTAKMGKKVGMGGAGTVGRMLKDPFYYGVLCYDKQEIDLRVVQADFIPMQTEEQWNEVQAIRYSNTQKHRSLKKGEKVAIFLPLREMVFCGVCGKKMAVYRTRGKNKAKHALLYYACQNKHCHRDKKQVRGKDVFADIYSILDDIQVSDEAFEEYDKATHAYTKEQFDTLNEEKLSLRGALCQLKAKLKQENMALKNLKQDSRIPESTIQASIDLVSELENQIIDTETKLNQIEAEIKDPAQVALTKDEFFELLETTSLQIKNGTFVEKDIVARSLFSKLVIDGQNKTTALFKTEFDGLISTNKTQHFENGEPGEARTLDTGLKRPVL